MTRYWISAFLITVHICAAADTLVIAHRGASAYLPEHTLPAVAMAYAQGADYIEQDVVLTKDDVPVVLHDIYLETTTDVAQRFPDRARDDGRFYAIDFTLEEIRSLRVGERRNDRGAVFPDRFPVDIQVLRVPTLVEEIELIQGLNRSTGREVGIYVELKEPDFHEAAGRSFSATVLQVLYAYGYRDAEDPVFLQCFDEGTLRFLSDHTEIRLVQLLEDKELTAARAAEIATYAQGVGPWIGFLASQPEFVAAAQAHGLVVHPFTFRADQLPPGVGSFAELLDAFIVEMQVDGIFTDHTNLARSYLDARQLP
ncbi:MAG: glycerophosphodiester phosphodiesterase [Pseudomonadota bacterium]